MKQAKLLFLLIATLAFASCRPTARQTAADAEQPTDSTETVTSADTLRMVIIDKSISRSDSVVQARIINPNDYDVNYGQEYTIERETDGHWQQVPFPKNFGFGWFILLYCFNRSYNRGGYCFFCFFGGRYIGRTKGFSGICW